MLQTVNSSAAVVHCQQLSLDHWLSALQCAVQTICEVVIKQDFYCICVGGIPKGFPLTKIFLPKVSLGWSTNRCLPQGTVSPFSKVSIFNLSNFAERYLESWHTNHFFVFQFFCSHKFWKFCTFEFWTCSLTFTNFVENHLKSWHTHFKRSLFS